MRDEKEVVRRGASSSLPAPHDQPHHAPVAFGGWDEKGIDGDAADDVEAEADSGSSLIPHPSSLSICLVSGGMDSCVTAAIAREESDEVAFLHVSYGQRTE